MKEDFILNKRIEYYGHLSNFLNEVKSSINKFISINENYKFEILYSELIKRNYVTIIFTKK